MLEPENIILAPILTEKSMGGRKERKYVFKVHSKSTKIDIKTAIKQLFNVDAVDVNIVNFHGKKRGVIRGVIGKIPGYKKAYIKLKTGQKIEELEA